MTVVVFKITGGSVRINSGDVKRVSKLRWCKVRSKNTFYARAAIHRNGKRTTVNMHNYIMGCPSQPVDHKDRDGLNNVRRNLRIVTHYENLQNYAGKKNKTHSKYKGVTKHYKYMWRACIQGRHIGLYYSEKEAAKAYDREALRLFGPNAFLNTAEYRL